MFMHLCLLLPFCICLIYEIIVAGIYKSKGIQHVLVTMSINRKIDEVAIQKFQFLDFILATIITVVADFSRIEYFVR